MTVLDDFQLQSAYCADFGSPFTSELLKRAGQDIAAGGIVAGLTANWQGQPRADAVSLRLAAALHAAALTNRDPLLAAEYPAREAAWSMDRVWPLARAFLDREQGFVRAFMTSPPQTNETARAMGLACGFLWLAERSPEPFHLLELGASAGLNLHWDRFAYGYPPWGRAQMPGPFIPTRVEGSPPGWRDISIASRAACDQNPLDPADPGDTLRLRAYIWADQATRMERLNAAIALAGQTGIRPERADAAQWVRARLSSGLPPGTTVIYHSVFLQYPPQPVRAAIQRAIEEAGRGATSDRRLAWLRFEPETIIGGVRRGPPYVLNVVFWENGRRDERTLAEVDPHGRSLVWSG